MRSALLSVCGLSLLLGELRRHDVGGPVRPLHGELLVLVRAETRGPVVSRGTMNGSVEITGWDKDTVEITGVKYAATEELLKAVTDRCSAGGGFGAHPHDSSQRDARQHRAPATRFTFPAERNWNG